MTLLVMKSWFLLLYFDLVMRFRPFRSLHRIVSNYGLRPQRSDPKSPAVLCHAVDIACVLYFKRVLCLQRSAATTLLLRSSGWNASMVIGAQVIPPAFHAWVEVGDCVVNDKPYVRTMYQPMESC